MRLEKLAFSELKFLNAGVSEKKEPIYGIKRHVNLQIQKLSNSIDKYGFKFPIIVAELPNGDKYLIDGYARWRKEDRKKTIGGFALNKHDAVVIEAKDLEEVKELYLQCQSVYGTATWDDFRRFEAQTSESDYEIPGIVHPNFDLSIMTREEIAKAMLESKYQLFYKEKED